MRFLEYLGGLLLILLIQLISIFVPPFILFYIAYEKYPVWVFVSAVLWVSIISEIFGSFLIRRQVQQLRFESHVFAMFTKSMWEENRLLSDAVWRKTHPEICPPWRTNSEETNDAG